MAEDTITLEQLRAVLRKIKGVRYGSSVEIQDDFKAGIEMIYNCCQKELIARSEIGMN